MKSFFNNFILLLILICCNHWIYAQAKEDFSFSVKNYDFGDIKEDGGSVVYEFEFVNEGDVAVTINNVRASCGCTTPGWSKEAVMPTEKGFVKVQFNPENRPGKFRKTLTITTDGEPKTVYLYINGNVLPVLKSVEQRLRAKMGDVRLMSTSLNVGKMTTEKIVTKTFEVYNHGEGDMSFLEKYEAPQFIKVSFDPQTLKPDELGKINIEYNPVHDDNLGFNNHGIKIFTNEESFEAKNLNILATITEFFPPLSKEELQQSPSLAIADRYRDIGSIYINSKISTEFVLTNTGKSKLNIRKVKSNCACFVGVLNTYNIKPGKSAVLTATFDSSRRKGNQNKTITIYSNDPLNPTQVISIKATVKSTN